MPFVKPMLAFPKPDNWEPRPGEWAVEEKFDGERFCIEIGNGPPRGLFTGKAIQAWSRYGRSRDLPKHIEAYLQAISANVILDGELTVPGGRSYGVKELTNQKDLVFIVFDILEIDGTTCCDLTYDQRRSLLEEMFLTRCYDPNHNGDEDGVRNLRGCGNDVCFNHKGWVRPRAVRLAWSINVNTLQSVEELRDEVWARDGEGLILKRRAAKRVSKRSKDYLKIKNLRHATLTVRGFCPSKGEVLDRGEYAIIVLQDDDGNYTTVKTLDDEAVERFNRLGLDEPPVWKDVRTPGGKLIRMRVNHPEVGRRACIEYQERTPDGSYRHGRFDRWEDE